ncbi:MAG: type II secretion system protein GspN [Deltaproteobacteria bacterium]|nr:type II secretion system protein GspN [Deltaproteobacteria bacterium]
MNARRILIGTAKGAGYVAFFVFCTLIFAVWTFPEDRAREFLEDKGGEALGAEVRIGELDLSVTGGAELTDVVVKLQPKKVAGPPGAPPPKPGPPRVLKIDRFEGDVGVFALALSRALHATFEMDMQGGTVRGGRLERVPEEGSELSIEAIEGVRLGPEGLFLALVGYDLQGVLGGTIDLKQGVDPSEIEGTVDVGLSSARIVKPVIPTRQLGPLTLSDVDLGELQLKLVAGKASEVGAARKGAVRGRGGDDTVIRFEDVGASGKDLELEFDDASVINVRQGEPLGNALIDIHFAVHFTDAFLEKRVKGDDGEMSQPNKILQMAFRQDARMRGSMRDGVLGIGCRGTLSKPDCKPEPPRVRGGFKTRKPRFTSGASEEPEPAAEPAEPAAEPDSTSGTGAPTGRGAVSARATAAAAARAAAKERAERAPVRGVSRSALDGAARPAPIAAPTPVTPLGRRNFPSARALPVPTETEAPGHDEAYPEEPPAEELEPEEPLEGEEPLPEEGEEPPLEGEEGLE